MGHTITRERWISHPLDPVERPNILYEYYVTGRGQFPWDMLRHDGCWPATSSDAALMDRNDVVPERHLRSLKMHSYQPPTVDRWSSFLWSVGNHKLGGS